MRTRILAEDLTDGLLFTENGQDWFVSAGVVNDTEIHVWSDPAMRGVGAPRIVAPINPKDHVGVVSMFIRTDGEHGNIFAIIAQVSLALKDAGVPEEMVAMLRRRVFNCDSYDQAVAILKAAVVAE